ncbi:angiogenic factor with G patch and FHA domains 1 [Coprinopsis cinerea okayama7|uniref:Angiogenic factor with G patch and FHA domains 1 n=1 Tax=Coprinopsis cinerea (strain Okayama-7 / 130 / ATCC MYA-4618 / FGSC 9003) TaxID=240176 RepID=A8NTV7_COPC7|nr:angiogenic factor with G patch and FHA domains 1 [Coprinopsis cinerea okayama7\|eukprot:XP_001836313.1 angiogenic factor with G patch and FHA domains 1 [Coprinopsis cinerea okayama7\
MSQYDPSYEWPGDDGNDDIRDAGNTTSTSFLRLVVQGSNCLPTKRRLAILTGFPEVQFGRDKPAASSVTPRIRLKEMEVSKVHATVFWNGAKKEWGIVDMGSKHGTFLRVHNPNNESPTVRLSPPRIASLPRTLHHMDEISIGSTRFTVHIHEGHLACIDCSSSDTNEISLFSTDEPKTRASVSLHSPSIQTPQNPKKSLAVLKQSLLRQHLTPTTGPGPSASYVDRAARRREIHGYAAGAPGISSQPPGLSMQTAVGSAGPLNAASSKDPVSDPPGPLPTSNIGHRLLSKMGWEPGTGLGYSSDGEVGGGIVEPVKVIQHDKRAGLGTKRPAPTDESWWESEKQRRFARFQTGPDGT